MCKACKKELSSLRYKDKKEEIKQTNKLWRESNPEAMQRARKNWMKNLINTALPFIGLVTVVEKLRYSLQILLKNYTK